MTDQPNQRTFKRLMEFVAEFEELRLKPWEKVNLQELGINEQDLNDRLSPLTGSEFQLFAEGGGDMVKDIIDLHNLQDIDDLLLDILWGDHLYHFFFADTVG